MATAPEPGTTRAPKTPIFRITVRGETLEFPAQVTLAEKMAVRLATGLPFEAFVPSEEQRIGMDCIAVLWWVARRANGEPRLPWRQFEQEWPAELGLDELDLEVVEDDGAPTDDPGKSEPA